MVKEFFTGAAGHRRAAGARGRLGREFSNAERTLDSKSLTLLRPLHYGNMLKT